MSRTTEDRKPAGEETATEEINRKEAGLPHGGVSPDYDEDDVDADADRSRKDGD